MRPEYDFVALGGGTAGLVSCRTVAAMGRRTAMIEAERPGGDCFYAGCVPSKSLLATAELAHSMRHADAFGLEPADPRPDFARVMDRVQDVIDKAGEADDPALLESEGVEGITGRGRFTGPGRI